MKTLLSLLLCFFFAHSAQAQIAPAFPKSSLSIQHADQRITTLDVELAQTPEQQQYGLMFRKSMPENHGMLFLFNSPRPVAMWMKNTHMPLDMLFINRDGEITKIVQNTTPGSLKTISSDTEVVAVLEINAMMANEWGIHVHDHVLHPAFANTVH